MAKPERGMPDAREVNLVEALLTVVDPEKVQDVLDRCFPGSTWTAHIRTASVAARVLAREPLGSLDERECTCVRLALDRPVPVEPGLRFRIVAGDDPGLSAACMVRPWNA
jgi:hypothetical protein